MVRVCRAGRNRFIACSCICPQHIASSERQGCATSCQYSSALSQERPIQTDIESSRAWLSDIKVPLPFSVASDSLLETDNNVILPTNHDNLTQHHFHQSTGHPLL
ncbi:hypothetical protein B0T13DRAFT_46219 [Neurospora crassa]|nr:hypothetical protein B0T13DRAFT_46219 [Neurospora crassa]